MSVNPYIINQNDINATIGLLFYSLLSMDNFTKCKMARVMLSL
ncbi:hypothetical protein Y11_41921 [Yersinia enterocolitica subsp. palearctica Y11]|uniref:Uncharacterized protein n=1 Tax=Yersinia enterocolitica subsp. palearctica serotype O:3 (strain DSM 13030 / CIP 106945 / Y11) TaxID=930944 RepID=A0A0H3NXV4_YERE1|nr:hypothetical protein IOK_15100 [Yersinia enterocolitica subsp. palearctica PhRBD_Ye1]EOR64821.1 hypothetical protein YEP1_20381 [Yersinia enterocolitica subsp. palearctica YE-P1]CBY28338.1 hypothetical protein Y11_41921 [Yersinia enterocolitica subsp. palearctica Y11]CCO66999.1 hypothetical protein D322_103 [Yersinia enterocolitica IP 10393]